MELPEIGKQCSVPDCKQLDFLPFECCCKFIFCREHFAEHVETCVAKQRDILNTGSCKTQSYACSKSGCSERSIVPLVCKKCNQHYCIAHRHISSCEQVDEQALQEAIDRVNAPKIQFAQAKAVVDKEVESTLKNAKRKDTANKVQLMRLKAKATGLMSIPTTNRLYFLISNPKYCPEGRPIFISCDWTIGRCIDAIADECKIPNNNNKTAGAKLRLFRKSDNEILSQIMSDKIYDLFSSSSVVNGDSLVLDYVTDMFKQ